MFLFSGLSIKLLGRQFEEVYSGKLPEVDSYIKLLNENDKKWESGDFVKNTEYYKNLMNDFEYAPLLRQDFPDASKKKYCGLKFTFKGMNKKILSAVSEKNLIKTIICNSAYAGAASVMNKSKKVMFSHLDIDFSRRILEAPSEIFWKS